MTKSVFLSAGGEPFITLLAIKLWQERWYDEVDKFYINYNNHSGVPVEVASEFCARVIKDPKVHLIYHPRGIGNGMPITEMTKIADTDLVMLLEDDGFIFEPGIVSKCFQQIESDLADVVGSPRFSCGVEVGEASKKKYNLDYSGYGDKGPNCWPNFFFCKLNDLLKTDLDFASHTWKPGEHCPHLDHTFKEINHGDTFVWTCVQLRAMGLRFHDVPQHHASPTEIEDKRTKALNWYGEPMKWIHGGSLSTGWGGYLSGRVPDTSTIGAKMEIETRVAFWQIAMDQVDGFNDFKEKYMLGIIDLVTNAELDSKRIEHKMKLYKGVMRI